MVEILGEAVSADPVISTIQVDEFLTAVCGHCRGEVVRLDGSWRHVLTGEIQCKLRMEPVPP